MFKRRPKSIPKTPNIIITGASDGIGLRLAQAYVNAGASVVATGRRSADELGSKLLHGMNYIQADQRDPAMAARSIRKTLERLDWQRCDLAILNAGTGWTGNSLDEPSNSIRDVINTNLTSHVLISLVLAPYLLANPKSHLAIIGSTAHNGATEFASYAASKAGLHGLARSLREEWHGKVKVQIIHPGPVSTDMHAKAGFNPGGLKVFFLNPKFVARAIRHEVKGNRSQVTINHFARLFDLLTFGWAWQR